MIPGARLILLGRQGAGKGTQCVRLSRHFVVPHISTGDIFRANVAGGPVTWAGVNLCDVKSVTLRRDSSAGAWVDYDQ